jgi:predicted NUDIX family NTP pyrophosphohydrolase
MYRWRDAGLEVFLVHPGGPFYARKDAGVWSVPKGEIDAEASALDVAQREFEEETGQPVTCCAPHPRFLELGTVVLKSGKVVHAWAFEGDWPHGAPFASNTFALEWPPGSGRRCEVPEIDRGEFVPLALARHRLHPGQLPFLDRLLERLGARAAGVSGDAAVERRAGGPGLSGEAP